MTIDRETVARDLRAGALHMTAMVAWLGALGAWGAYCERRRQKTCASASSGPRASR